MASLTSAASCVADRSLASLISVSTRSQNCCSVSFMILAVHHCCGWKGAPRSEDVEQLHLEHQRAVGAYGAAGAALPVGQLVGNVQAPLGAHRHQLQGLGPAGDRSEERRVGKEWRSRWSAERKTEQQV